jgi:hypothetical protein
MEKERLKKELVDKIQKCEDLATLQRVEEVFTEFSEVNEGNEKYLKEVDTIPDSHYQKLEEDFKKYRSGELKGISWEEFRKEITSKYGF